MIDAYSVRADGREPVRRSEHRGWTIEVYRLGRRHEYQAIAQPPDGPGTQTRRVGGSGALSVAYDLGVKIVDSIVDAAAEGRVIHWP